ncbi:MAG: hypothetical protein QOG85_1588 [Gaiellaceae bacterium]|nr:hypothetical protein [Gaiellaceae bacterium]
MRLNGTVRGLLIIAAVAAVIVFLQLWTTRAVLVLHARLAVFLAIAFFVFLMWREQRGGIAMWPQRAQVVFYGSAVVAVADVGAYWYGGARGMQVLAFVAILALCGISMFRTWREQHRYV